MKESLALLFSEHLKDFSSFDMMMFWVIHSPLCPPSGLKLKIKRFHLKKDKNSNTQM